MSTQEQELEQIQLSLENAKEKVDLAKSLDILKNNEHFKKLFLDKYLKSYAVRLVMLKASVGMQEEKHQKNIMDQLNGIGQMSQYMGYIEQEGYLAAKSIEDYENERDQILE